MGDVNQIIYLTRHVPDAEGAILEVGSRNYGNTASFRNVYKRCEYVGVDMSEGDGVDRIVDLSEGVGDLPTGYFSLIICCSVMEHTPAPWRMAENLTRLLRPGGLLYVSVPWVWRYHPYPDDYFRFSFRGVEALFQDIAWQRTDYSTTVAGEFVPITAENASSDNALALLVPVRNPKLGATAQVAADKQIRKQVPEVLRPHQTFETRRKYLPYLMVNMIGERSA